MEVNPKEFERLKANGTLIISSSGEEYILISGFLIKKSYYDIERSEKEWQLNENLNL